MDKKQYDSYVGILQQELIPALGCTEPIAIALAAATARETLGEFPESLSMVCSGNIIKNVKGVTVPNSGGLKGIEIAATLGCVGGDAKKIAMMWSIDINVWVSCFLECLVLYNDNVCKEYFGETRMSHVKL